MKKGALPFLLLIFVCIILQASATTIVQATDLHYLSPNLSNNSPYLASLLENGDGKTTLYCSEVVDAFVDEMIVLKPDAIILTGDLTFNGAKQSHSDLKKALQPIMQAGIKVYVLPGNHDMYNSNARYFSSTSSCAVESADSHWFEELYQDFGFSDAISCDTDSISYSVQISNNLMLIMIDTNKEGRQCALSNTSLAWIEQQLQYALENDLHVIVASHQNVIQQSIFSSGNTIAQSTRLKDLFVKYHVGFSVSGHLHMQRMKSYRSFTEIATSSLSVWPCEYAVITADESGIQYQTKELSVAEWAARNGIQDENLLYFSEYSKQLLDKRFTDQGFNLISGYYPDETVKSMVQYASKSNLMFFSGDFSAYDLLDPGDEIRSKWNELESGYAKYIASIGDDSGKIMNKLELLWK